MEGPRRTAVILAALALLLGSPGLAQVGTFTPIETFTPVQTLTPFRTFTPIQTFTPVRTFTPIPTSTFPGRTATPTRSGTVTPTSAQSPTPSPTGATGTPTASGTPTRTRTRTPVRSPTPIPPNDLCFGDCDFDGRVSIGELILAVRVAFNPDALGECPGLDVNGDLAVSITEVFIALNQALDGCPTS